MHRLRVWRSIAVPLKGLLLRRSLEGLPKSLVQFILWIRDISVIPSHKAGL